MLDPRNFFAPYIGPPGLQIVVEGGVLLISGGGVVVSSTSVTLPANTTSYVYLNTSSGVVTSNTSGFPTSNCYPIATVITGQSGIASLTDNRPDVTGTGGGGGGANFTAGVSGGNTSGTSGTVSNAFVLAGGNNITLSATTAVGGMTATISAANQTVQTQNLHDLTIGGNTAGVGALISSGTLALAGGNNITLSQNGQNISIVGGAGGAGFTGGVSGGNTSGTSGTISASLLLAGGNNITLSAATAAGGIMSVTISGPNTAAQTVQTDGFYVVSQSMGQSSFSTVDARSISIAASGNMSAGLSAGSLIFSVPAQTNQTIGLYASSNTTQSTTGTADARSLTFVGEGIASVGVTNGSVVISVPSGGGAAGSQTLGMSNLGNTAGTSGVVSGSAVQFLLAGGNNITLSQSINGASATISVSQNEVTFSKYYWPAIQLYSAQSSSSFTNGSMSLQYVPLYNWVTFTRVDTPLMVSVGSSATAATAAVGITAGLCFYTLNGSTLNPVLGVQASSTFTWASNTANFSNLSGIRYLSFGLGTLMSPGEYYAGVWLSTTSGLSVGTATSNNNITFSQFYQNPEFLSSGCGDFNSAISATSNILYIGCLSSNFTATSQTLQLSQFTFTGTAFARGNYALIFRNY